MGRVDGGLKRSEPGMVGARCAVAVKNHPGVAGEI